MAVYQNLLEEMQGNWICTKAINQKSEQPLNLEFSLLISENIISRNGDGSQYWPNICNFELVGSIKDGYFYREDGCFMQIKTITDKELKIELSVRSEQEAINSFVFSFQKELEY